VTNRTSPLSRGSHGQIAGRARDLFPDAITDPRMSLARAVHCIAVRRGAYGNTRSCRREVAHCGGSPRSRARRSRHAEKPAASYPPSRSWTGSPPHWTPTSSSRLPHTLRSTQRTCRRAQVGSAHAYALNCMPTHVAQAESSVAMPVLPGLAGGQVADSVSTSSRADGSMCRAQNAPFWPSAGEWHGTRPSRGPHRPSDASTPADLVTKKGALRVLGCDHRCLGESPPRSEAGACVLPAKLRDEGPRL